MPRPIDDQLRADILRDIQDGQARNHIARTRGVAPATVTKIAQQAGLTNAFDRSQTEKGTRAKLFDARAARAQLIEDLYADAQRFRERAWSPYEQLITGPEGTDAVTTTLPPLRDQQSAYTALGICMDKAGRAEDKNGDSRNESARSLLGSLFDGLAREFGSGYGDGGGE